MFELATKKPTNIVSPVVDTDDDNLIPPAGMSKSEAIAIRGATYGLRMNNGTLVVFEPRLTAKKSSIYMECSVITDITVLGFSAYMLNQGVSVQVSSRKRNENGFFESGGGKRTLGSGAGTEGDGRMNLAFRFKPDTIKQNGEDIERGESFYSVFIDLGKPAQAVWQAWETRNQENPTFFELDHDSIGIPHETEEQRQARIDEAVAKRQLNQARAAQSAGATPTVKVGQRRDSKAKTKETAAA